MKEQASGFKDMNIYDLIDRIERIADITGRKNRANLFFSDVYVNNGVHYSYQTIREVIRSLKTNIPRYSLDTIIKASQQTDSKVPAILLDEKLDVRYIDEIKALKDRASILAVRNIFDYNMGIRTQNACSQSLDCFYAKKISKLRDRDSIIKCLKNIERDLNCKDEYLESYQLGISKVAKIFKKEARSMKTSISIGILINELDRKLPNLTRTFIGKELMRKLSNRRNWLVSKELLIRIATIKTPDEIRIIRQEVARHPSMLIDIIADFKSISAIKELSNTASEDCSFRKLYDCCPIGYKKRLLLKWSQVIDENSNSNMTIYLNFVSLFSDDKSILNILKNKAIYCFESKNNISEICALIDEMGENYSILQNCEIQTKIAHTISKATPSELKLFGNQLLVKCKHRTSALAFVNQLLNFNQSFDEIVDTCSQIGFSLKELVEIDELIESTLAIIYKEEIKQAIDSSCLNNLCIHIDNFSRPKQHHLHDLAIKKAATLATN